MKRGRIKRIISEPNVTNDSEKNFPRVTIRKNGSPNISNPRHNISKNNTQRSFKKNTLINRGPVENKIIPPIKFMEDNLPITKNKICFVVGGGPSLNGFDFSQLNGFDSIAVNKAV